MFWTAAPSLTPRVLSEGEQRDDDDRGEVRGVEADVHVAEHHGPIGMAGRADVPEPVAALTQGKKTPRNLPKATPTAAMVPVWMTRNSVQP